VAFYVVLKRMFPPEMSAVPGGGAFIRTELGRLGPIRRAEWNVLVCFLLMIVLFLMPPVAALALGSSHPTAAWLTRRFDIWVVPPIVLVALFVLPIDLRRSEFTLHWRDAVEHIPWNVILLSTAATAMLEVLAEFGFIKLIGSALNDVTVDVLMLPVIGLILASYTNIDGSAIAFTAGFGGILIPAAVRMGLHPTTVTMMIPQVAIGMLWPGSGPAAATAFASQKIAMKDMVKAGLIATPLFGFIVGLVHMMFELAT
jgi:sodium-dependent dicarboxylate transporter 2/3/5